MVDPLNEHGVNRRPDTLVITDLWEDVEIFNIPRSLTIT